MFFPVVIPNRSEGISSLYTGLGGVVVVLVGLWMGHAGLKHFLWKPGSSLPVEYQHSVRETQRVRMITHGFL